MISAHKTQIAFLEVSVDIEDVIDVYNLEEYTNTADTNPPKLFQTVIGSDLNENDNGCFLSVSIISMQLHDRSKQNNQQDTQDTDVDSRPVFPIACMVTTSDSNNMYVVHTEYHPRQVTTTFFKAVSHNTRIEHVPFYAIIREKQHLHSTDRYFHKEDAFKGNSDRLFDAIRDLDWHVVLHDEVIKSFKQMQKSRMSSLTRVFLGPNVTRIYKTLQSYKTNMNVLTLEQARKDVSFMMGGLWDKIKVVTQTNTRSMQFMKQLQASSYVLYQAEVVTHT